MKVLREASGIDRIGWTTTAGLGVSNENSTFQRGILRNPCESERGFSHTAMNPARRGPTKAPEPFTAAELGVARSAFAIQWPTTLIMATKPPREPGEPGVFGGNQPNGWECEI